MQALFIFRFLPPKPLRMKLSFISPVPFLLLIIFVFQSCNVQKTAQIEEQVVNLDTILIRPNPEMEIYRGSETRINDLLHTKLEVSFDWDSTYLYGKAYLKFRPYFYPTDSLILDAKGFQIKEVALLDSIGKKKALNYDYDSLKLYIDLDSTYRRQDTYSIFIDYVAMPNKLEEGGSQAITSDIGLYFINPDGSDPYKPKQIWTQGETEASSCWYPTIDSPNERMMQEIYITVDTQNVTLSNGVLMFQTLNGDGTRTDYWKMLLPHAPYLTMMAVGDFAIVEDSYKGKPVNYYVEPEYKKIAPKIYPNTVEMIGFFSELLGVEYPWSKYDQIVVRDYVSGAMENTTAVIYGEFIQGDERFLIDNSGEDIVAHELIHHWFGNLVTTESWSNLPLNEAFATYGEYLWREYKYGKDAAAYHLHQDLLAYLREAEVERKPLIRFHYGHRMEMFDRHSYQKGGRVLHMLRKTVGDEAFFLSLKKYLEDNAYTAVEIHNLRLAFEEVTGEDLNWFFNQWFMEKGHPVIKANWDFIDSSNKVSLKLEQIQKGEGIVKTFKLPMALDIYTHSGKQREEIIMSKRLQEFVFDVDDKPTLVNVDAEKYLLAEFIEDKPAAEWRVLFDLGENYLSKQQAVKKLKTESDSLSLNIIEKALNNPFWDIRETAIESMDNLIYARPEKSKNILLNLAKEDPKSDVRLEAITVLINDFREESPKELFVELLNDSSYLVVSGALEALYAKDSTLGYEKAKELETLNSDDVKTSIATIYAIGEKPSDHLFYLNNLPKMGQYSVYGFMQAYSKFLNTQELEVQKEALPLMAKGARNSKTWWMKLTYINVLKQIEKTAKKAGEKEGKTEEEVKTILEDLKKNETHPVILQVLKN